MDRHVRPSSDVDRFAVAGHLRQEQEALGDQHHRLLPAQPHQRLERLPQAAQADLGASPDLRDALFLHDRGVRIADNGELAGTAAGSGAGAGDGGGHPADPLLAVLEGAQPRPVGVAVADTLSDEAADDARELPVLPGVPRRPPQLLLRRHDGDPVALADVGREEAPQGHADPLHGRVRYVYVVDEEEEAAALGRSAQASTGQARRLVVGRRATAAHDDRFEGLDRLPAAFLLDREVLPREARHRTVVLVEHDHVEAHEVDAGTEDRRRRGLGGGLAATVGGSEQERGKGAEGSQGRRSRPHVDSRPEAAGRVNEARGR